MFQVPVGPAKICAVSRNARLTRLERVVGPEAAGEDAEPELEMRNAFTGHARRHVSQFLRREEGGVVGKKRVLFSNFINLAKASPSAAHKMGKPTWQVMLRTSTGMAKELLACVSG